MAITPTAAATVAGRDLRVRTLGPCTVEIGGEAVPIGGPRQRSVLLRLALAEGRLVTVDGLVADLWGDEAPASVVGTLHGYVSRLRSALDDPARLRREGPGYLLDVEPDEVDFRRFEALLHAATGADAEIALGHLDEALALWRGPALVEVADTEWAGPIAVRLEERRLEALEQRFDALLRLGRHGAAVSEIELAVGDHPLRERFAAQLMLALYRNGRQADALRVFERTRRVLADEVGLDPSPELVALEAAILSHDPLLHDDPGPARTDGGGGAASPAAPSASPAPLPPAAARHGGRPFVGRGDALREIHGLWQAVVSGERRLVLIEGEAGAGKSRLAARVATDVHHGGAIVIWGRSPEESILPYAPVVEALRTVVSDLSPEARHRIVEAPPGLRSLRPFLVDDEPGADPGADGAVDPVTDRWVLFEAVSELLRSESLVAPVLFVLDDLQWADLPTLQMLRHVMAHQRDGRVLLLATVRTVPAPTNPDLDVFLAELHRDRLLSRVVLDGLSAPEVAELLDATGSPVPPAEVGGIHTATRGNPFFVTELVEHGDVTSVPASVRDVLGARMVRLAADTLRLLSVAAIAGTSAPLPVLAAASGLHGSALVDALDEAVAAGFLAEEGDEGGVVFRHALVAQVVADRLSRTRRQGLHLDVAEAFAAAGGQQLDVAHHLLEAGPLVDPGRAAAASVDAGREALALLAYEAGVEWAERALSVAGATDPAIRSRALVLRSDAQRALGDRDAARDSAAAAADDARLAGDPSLLAGAVEALALARAGLGFDFGTTDESLHDLLGDALSGLLPPMAGPTPEPVGVTDLRGVPLDALETAAALGHHGLVATAHLVARMANWRADTLTERLDHDRRALAAAERSGQIPLQLNALLYLATDLMEAGDAAASAARFERVRELAALVRQPMYDAFVDFFDARDALLRGEYERSAELADRGLERGAQSHGVNAELAWSGQVFIRAWDRGELGGMVELLDAATARAPRATIFAVARHLSLLEAGRGADVAATVHDDVHSTWLDLNRDSLWLATGGLFTEISRSLGDTEVAALALEALLPYRGRHAVTGLGRASLGPVDRFVGIGALTTGDLDLAVDALGAAVEQAAAAGATTVHARALHDLADALTAAGDPGAADRHRREARALADPIGLVLGPIGHRSG